MQAFSDIKNYYNDITHNNLDLIKTLKEDVAEMKKKDNQNEKLMFEIAQENKRLSEPLQKVCSSFLTYTHDCIEHAHVTYVCVLDNQVYECLNNMCAVCTFLTAN